MPRRRILSTSLPPRPDDRRRRGNATDAQRRPRHVRPGQLEAIAQRRVRAFELRKAGASYREIGRELGVDVHTAHSDIAAELAALRETAVGEATGLRALELERLDGMIAGLWPQVRTGSAPAVAALVRVSERRSRLLGLDAPTSLRTEVTGSLSVEAQTQLKAERETFSALTLEQMAVLAAESDALVAKARAMVAANLGMGGAPKSPIPMLQATTMALSPPPEPD